MRTVRPTGVTSKTDRITRPRARGGVGATLGTKRDAYRRQWDMVSRRGLRTGRHSAGYASIDEVPDELRIRAEAKFGYISRFVAGGCMRGLLKPYAHAHAQTFDPPHEVPAYTTLCEWVKRYNAYDGILGLVDRPSGRRPRKQKSALNQAQRHLLAELAASRITPASAARQVAALGTKPKSANAFRAAVRRELARCRQAQPHLAIMAAEGGPGHRARQQITIRRAAMLPGKSLMVDSTVADLWIQVPHFERPLERVAMRPILTLITDEGSRRLVTFGVFLTPLSADIARSLLGRAFVPGANWKGMPTLALPQQVNVDHGSEHRGKFGETLEALGVQAVNRDPNRPQGGSRIERTHLTVLQGLLVNLIGYSAHMKATRTTTDDLVPVVDDDARKLADLRYEKRRIEISPSSLLTRAELEEKIRVFAVRFNATPHVGLSTADASLMHLLAPVLSAAV